MLFLFGALIVAYAYIKLRREEDSETIADRIFYFGLFLIALGLAFVLLQLLSRHR